MRVQAPGGLFECSDPSCWSKQPGCRCGPGTYDCWRRRYCPPPVPVHPATAYGFADTQRAADAVGYRDPATSAKIALKALARRILMLNDEIADLDRL